MPTFAHAVLGYGAIIPISQWVQRFPGTFTQYQNPFAQAPGYMPVRGIPQQWSPTEAMEDLENRLGSFRVYYPKDEDGLVLDLFLTSTDAAGPGQVDINRVLQNSQSVGNWIQQIFPGAQVGLILYPYEVFE